MELRLNRETEIQMKTAKMTPEEKEAYLKGLENNEPNVKEKLFGERALNGENQTITEEGVNLYTPEISLSPKTSSETKNIMLPDFKNEQQTLLFTFYGKNWNIVDTIFDITQFEFKKDSNGNITDIYPKNSDKADDIFGTKADRYSLRYDSQGNLIKSFKQDIDENGNIRGQEIKNYNADGTVKNTSYYRYTYDENGNQTGQTRSVVSEKYGDDGNILQEIFGEELENYGLMTFYHVPAVGERSHFVTYDNRGDVTYNQDGTVSEITYKGNKYMLRYDDEGNLTKAIKQSFSEDGTINNQEITTFGSDGAKIKEVRTYDEQGIDNTSDAQKAINNVRKLYTTKSPNVSESENASNKLKAFIENDTLAKLNAAGVSKEDIEALLKELFGDDLDEFLYNKNFLDSNLKGLYNKFEQQKQKIGLEPKLFY